MGILVDVVATRAKLVKCKANTVKAGTLPKKSKDRRAVHAPILQPLVVSMEALRTAEAIAR